jgi:hypothetical protein
LLILLSRSTVFLHVCSATDGKAVIPPTVRTFMGQGPKFSMAGRTRPVRSDMTPASTTYNPLVALKFVAPKVPSYSMAAKFRTIERDPYFVANQAQDGKAVIPPVVKSLIGQGPKYSMSGRTRHPRDAELPAPGQYGGTNTNMVGTSGPKFSMSARVKKGIAYGYFGDEPRLQETRVLPSLQVVESR